jgi:superfamily II DNA/RNA helicase
MPDTVEAYMHRIGRTGRATRTGVAFTLATHEDTAMVYTIEQALGAPLERRTLQDFDHAMPNVASDTDRDRFQRPQRRPSQSAPVRAGVQGGVRTQVEMPHSIPALQMSGPAGIGAGAGASSGAGASLGRPSSRRWQPGATVRRRW